MKLWPFADYESYKKAQIKGSHRRPNRRPAIDKIEIDAIVAEWKDRPTPGKVLCHGARCGTELNLFQAAWPAAVLIGTDLAPRVPSVLEWDFNQPNAEWTGKMDLVYSNSLDHSPNPLETVRTWLDQLTPEGLLFVQWNSQHVTIIANAASMYPGGDCFGSSLDEFIRVFETVGTVKGLLYLSMSRRGGTRVLVVASRRTA